MNNTIVTSFAVGGIFHRRIEGDLQILALQYESPSRTTWRLPVGRGRPPHNLRYVLHRQMGTELSFSTKAFRFTYTLVEPVWTQDGLDERIPNGIHQKLFFLLDEPLGALRREPLIDRSNPNPRFHKRLHPPQWVEASQLIELLRKTNTPAAHVSALLAGLECLASYKELLSSLTTIPPCTTCRTLISLGREPRQ